MAQARGVREGNFLVEIDGIDDFRATKLSGGVEKQAPVQISYGNDRRKENVPGNVDPEDVTITIASGRNDNAIRQLFRWHDDYKDNIDVEPRSARYVVFDSTGSTPLETYELQDCVPISIGPDNRSADGTGASLVTMVIKPYRVRLL